MGPFFVQFAYANSGAEWCWIDAPGQRWPKPLRRHGQRARQGVVWGAWRDFVPPSTPAIKDSRPYPGGCSLPQRGPMVL